MCKWFASKEFTSKSTFSLYGHYQLSLYFKVYNEQPILLQKKQMNVSWRILTYPDVLVVILRLPKVLICIRIKKKKGEQNVTLKLGNLTFIKLHSKKLPKAIFLVIFFSSNSTTWYPVPFGHVSTTLVHFTRPGEDCIKNSLTYGPVWYLCPLRRKVYPEWQGDRSPRRRGKNIKTRIFNLKDSVGLILFKVSPVWVTIPIDLSQ
jgi:hypothetical protein